MVQFKRIFCALLFFILTGCGSQIIYYGRSYAPTQNVDIYFRESDVKEPNEVMGKVTLEMTTRKSSDKIQKKLIKRAQKKGADAILFDEISLTTIGSESTGATAGNSSSNSNRTNRSFLGISGSKTKYEIGQLIKGTLLKYNKNK